MGDVVESQEVDTKSPMRGVYSPSTLDWSSEYRGFPHTTEKDRGNKTTCQTARPYRPIYHTVPHFKSTVLSQSRGYQIRFHEFKIELHSPR
jgi:hypothetical protein